MASRGRDALKTQFKSFYRDELDNIRKFAANRDYFVLLNLFAQWLGQRSSVFAPTLSEKISNIVLARTIPEWSHFCAIVESAAEEMFWDTPTITKQEALIP